MPGSLFLVIAVNALYGAMGLDTRAQPARQQQDAESTY
jgi:hypothetical protein